MPRVTIKGLTQANEILLQANCELKADLQARKDRSRSRHRKAAFKVEPISARTMRALDIVCKHDRDPVIEEQRVIMTKQAQEIERLKRGEGLIKPVLCAAFNFTDNNSCNTSETMQTYVKRLWNENNNISMGMLLGNRNR